MANYFYVKSGGTATGATTDASATNGVATGALTGTWSVTASEYFDNIRDATVGVVSPTAGDFILCSDAHAFSGDAGGGPIINSGGITTAPIQVISVDNGNRENYKPGASETLTDAIDEYHPQGNVLFAGVSLGTNDNIFEPDTLSSVHVQDATLTVTSTTDAIIYVDTDGQFYRFTNVDLAGTGSDVFYITRGATVIWNGGSLSGTWTDIIGNIVSDGGASIYMNGVDLSVYNGALISTQTSSTNCFYMRMENCRLHASVTLPTTHLVSVMHRFEMFNCDDSTGGDFHRFYIADGAGVAKNNDATYITADEAWAYDGSTKSSIEVTTTSYCSNAKPFVFELPAQYVDLSSASTDKITIELTTDLTLTDTDIAAFLCYPDGTTPVQANWVTSGKTVGTGNYGIDPLAAGTTLTSSALGAGDWTGEPTSPNFYVLELDTSGDAGAATAVSIRIEVYKASIAAGKLFISPQISLS